MGWYTVEERLCEVRTDREIWRMVTVHNNPGVLSNEEYDRFTVLNSMSVKERLPLISINPQMQKKAEGGRIDGGRPAGSSAEKAR